MNKRISGIVVTVAVTLLVLAAIAFGPLEDHVAGSKARFAAGLVDGVSQSLIGVLGLQVALFGIAVLGIVAVGLQVARMTASGRGGSADAPAIPRTQLRAERRVAALQQADAELKPGRLASVQARRDAEFPPPVAAEPEPAPDFPTPVVLARKPRQPGSDWAASTSWLGGLPRLGDIPWPGDAKGVPLVFAAQVDLAELARACPDSPLPQDGTLAFFLGGGHAVLHVPAGPGKDTPLPPGAPFARQLGGYPLPTEPSRLNRKAFRKWPVDLIPLDLPDALRDHRDEERHEEIHEAMDAALAAQVPGREFAYAPEAGDAQPPLWWYGVKVLHAQLLDALDHAPRRIARQREQIAQASQRLADLEAMEPPLADHEAQARSSRGWIEGSEKRIPELMAQVPLVEDFAARIGAMVKDKPMLGRLTPSEVADIAAVIDEARKTAREVVTFHIPHAVRELTTICIKEMFTGSEAALAEVPPGERDRINASQRLTSETQHQMFGLGRCKQTALYDQLEEGQVMLLQIGYDDMMDWQFGDMGIFQYWISPEDLAAQRWDKVQLTFECA